MATLQANITIQNQSSQTLILAQNDSSNNATQKIDPNTSAGFSEDSYTDIQSTVVYQFTTSDNQYGEVQCKWHIPLVGGNTASTCPLPGFVLKTSCTNPAGEGDKVNITFFISD